MTTFINPEALIKINASKYLNLRTFSRHVFSRSLTPFPVSTISAPPRYCTHCVAAWSRFWRPNPFWVPLKSQTCCLYLGSRNGSFRNKLKSVGVRLICQRCSVHRLDPDRCSRVSPRLGKWSAVSLRVFIKFGSIVTIRCRAQLVSKNSRGNFIRHFLSVSSWGRAPCRFRRRISQSCMSSPSGETLSWLCCWSSSWDSLSE